MATLIRIYGKGTDADKDGAITVSEDFDAAFNKFYPLTPPSSSLQARENMVHSLVDGRRIAIQGAHVIYIEVAADDHHEDDN